MKLLVNRSLRRVLALFLAVVALFCVLGMNYSENRRVVAEGEEKTYTKVTEAPTDWSGEYLIVYETGSVAFDGSLTTFDAVGNTQAVTITDGKITTNTSYAFTIAAVEGGYSIQGSSNKYFGNDSNSNALTTADSALVNTISLNDDTVNIIGKGGAYLRYNAASNQTRFRYYKSSSYTGQKAITLYKLTEATGDTTCEHANTTEEIVDATCTTAGSKNIVCSDCDYVISTETIPATGHKINSINGVCENCEKKGHTKVTVEPEDWSGKYAIVYEAGKLAFDGKFEETLDASGNTKAVTIENELITNETAETLSYFIIEKMEGGYSIQSQSGKYIGKSADSNGMDKEEEPAANTISLNADGSVQITGAGGAVLRYNSASNQLRFRYYKTSSYENQQPIALYKVEDPVTDKFEAIETEASLQLSYNAESELVADLRFGATFDSEIVETLTNAGATFGMKIESNAEGTEVQYLNDWQPEGGNYALVITEIASKETVFTASIYVEIDGVKYYTTEAEYSIKTLAQWYLANVKLNAASQAALEQLVA